MSIELSLLTGIVAAAGGIVSLLKPLISSHLQKKMEESIIVSIKMKDGDTRTVELHGETGKEAIEKLLKGLTEAKNGDEATNPK